MTDDAHVQSRPDTSARRPPVSRARLFIICAAVFLVALGVRALHWQDSRHAFVYEGMAVEYKMHALLLCEGDVMRFVRGDESPPQASIIKHPPGYPLLLAAVYSVFGVSDTPVRALHIVLDAAAAVLVLLLALELFPAAVAVISGSLVALSPQFAYHAITLVPDPLAAPPILLAFYLLARARKRPRLVSVAAAGAMIGLSCWLRSNALLLAPFVALLAPLLFERGRRLRPALVLAGASLLLIAPVTIRNAVVYRAFIPLSLSAGITLVEGIGIYDREGRFGLPSSDYGVTKWEAEMYGRPDYLGTRFDPDGVERERRRVAHGLAVIRSHPFWFLRVMAHRAASMWRLARVETVSAEPAIANVPDPGEGARPAWTIDPSDLTNDGAGTAVESELRTTDGSSALRFAGEQMGTLVVSPPTAVQKNTDYLLRLPLKIEQGSVVVEVRDARRDAVLASTPILHPIDYLDFTPDTQPAVGVARPFVSGDAEEVRVVLRNAGQRPVAAEAGRVEAYALGPSAHAWMRFPRLLVRGAQKLFLTAFVLPFIVLGVVLLARARRWGALALLLSVPVYYMCTQSALWTEFRYILPMHYFLLILAALGLSQTLMLLRRIVLKLWGRNTT